MSEVMRKDDDVMLCGRCRVCAGEEEKEEKECYCLGEGERQVDVEVWGREGRKRMRGVLRTIEVSNNRANTR